MEKYEAASYQNDVINSFKYESNLYLYGPGFINYNIEDDIREIIAKSSFVPDLIILGHSWLGDKDSIDIDFHPNLKINTVKVPKFAILNKEYVNLNEKLNYIKKNKFDFCFTHHHDIEYYRKKNKY